MARSSQSGVSSRSRSVNQGMPGLEPMAENYSARLAWKIADRRRVYLQIGIKCYTSTGVHITHPTLLTKLRIMWLNAHYRNRHANGPLWKAADLCAWLGIVGHEHPEISQDATDLEVQLKEKYVKHHNEFMELVYNFLGALMNKLQGGGNV